MSPVAFYISGHGFGHAIRQLAIVEQVLALSPPDLHVVIRSEVPERIVTRVLRDRFTLIPGETDPGVAQIDALHVDAAATARRVRKFYRDIEARSRAEAALLRRVDAALVVSDAPPLACAASRQADIPAFVCANISWDWIYEAFLDPETAGTVLPLLRRTYGTAAGVWRLPLHGGFGWAPAIVDVPLVCRRARTEYARDRIRYELGLPVDRPLALVSFGGYGVDDLPLARLDCTPEWGVIVTTPDDRAGDLPPGVHGVSESHIAARGLRYEDLVHAADAVVSKPGYGIISDCVAHERALLYTSRGTFPEYDVLVREMPRFLRVQYLEQERLMDGKWREALEALRAQPAPPERLRTDGAEVVARMILARL